MSASGYTPILIYGSTTASNVPLAANLTTSSSGVELAINAADGKLFYKDSGGTVQVLATKGAAQNSISFGTTGLTPNTATQGAVTVAGTLITSNGGTGLSSYTSGDLPYYASGTALSKLGIGTSGQILTSSGTAPQWSTLSGVAVTTFSAGTTGFTPSSATSGAITLSGTLATTNGGTGLTSFTANGVVYASSTSALTTGSALTFDGTTFRTLSGAVASGGSVNGKFRLDRSDGTTNLGYIDWVTVADGMRFYNNNGGYFSWEQSSAGELMRLTSTGLGIGTTSPISRLHVNSFSTNTTTITVGNNNGGTQIGFDSTNASFVSAYANNALRFGYNSGSTFVETARIDSSGNLLFGGAYGTSVASGMAITNPTSATIMYIGHAVGTASGSVYSEFRYNTTTIGTITQNGTTGVLYNITSDYRLKNVLGAVSGQGARIDALEPIEYEWKADGSRTRGFLAHKFQEVYPGSVNGEKDAVDAEGKPVYQTMQASTSEVIADLVAEIKSLRQRLAAAGL